MVFKSLTSKLPRNSVSSPQDENVERTLNGRDGVEYEKI